MDVVTTTPANPKALSGLKMDLSWHAISLLNPIAIGNTASTRVGNNIYVRYIQVSISFVGDAVANANGMTCRYMALKTHANGAAVPAAAQLYNIGPLGTVAFQSLRNWDTNNRYRTVFDRQHHVTNTTTTTNTSNGVVQCFIPVYQKIQYTGATVDCSGSNLMTNDVLLAMCSSVTNCCTISISWRVIFNDM